jgi:S1-C subfamily serine protease
VTKDGSDVVVTPSGSVRASRTLRWSVAVVAVAYIGYLALLVTCDLRRVAPFGFVPLFKPDAIFIPDVQPDSIAARAGLQAGDRIRRANGQVLEGRTDWQRVRVYLDPSKPLQLEIERSGRSSAARRSVSSNNATAKQA